MWRREKSASQQLLQGAEVLCSPAPHVLSPVQRLAYAGRKACAAHATHALCEGVEVVFSVLALPLTVPSLCFSLLLRCGDCSNWDGMYVLYTYAAKRQTARNVQLLLSNPEAGSEDKILRHITLCRL
eukprot:GHRQ01026792.1.p1 GENE.GHRQ01026792.1~~GHRQ01026792.1.p1  ORF type:complete len:127 (-),score=32.89 GHRQ01026792.1:88-468(-)